MTKRSTWPNYGLLLLLFLFGCKSQSATVTAVAEPSSPGPLLTETSTEAPGSESPTSAATILSQPGKTVSPAPLQTPSSTAAATPVPTATPEPTPTVPASVIELPGASLPPGFSIIAFAELFRPTALAWDGDGRIYAASQDGTIHLLEDTNGDGRADSDILFSFGFAIPLGITVAPDGETLFVSSNSKISTLRDSDGDKVADEIANFTSGLPVGQHQNNNLKFGPDGQLYIGVGSTCDVCYEIDDRSATIMRFDPVSGAGEVFARGLRNTYDIAFHPFSGELFATDNGRDDLGMDAPKEELNLIGQGLDYGWPDCWDEGEGPRCEGTETAVAFFESHSSANSIDFYAGDRFPPSYRSDQQGAVAYVGIFGSWLKPDVTTGIVRVRLIRGENGYDSEVSWFAQLPGAMPLGLIAGEDGAIYVGDFINDRIYRISYGN